MPILGSYIESATALSDDFIARNHGFWRAPEIDFRYETDFKFDALYRYVFIESLQKSG